MRMHLCKLPHSSSRTNAPVQPPWYKRVPPTHTPQRHLCNTIPHCETCPCRGGCSPALGPRCGPAPLPGGFAAAAAASPDPPAQGPPPHRHSLSLPPPKRYKIEQNGLKAVCRRTVPLLGGRCRAAPTTQPSRPRSPSLLGLARRLRSAAHSGSRYVQPGAGAPARPAQPPPPSGSILPPLSA